MNNCRIYFCNLVVNFRFLQSFKLILIDATLIAFKKCNLYNIYYSFTTYGLHYLRSPWKITNIMVRHLTNPWVRGVVLLLYKVLFQIWSKLRIIKTSWKMMHLGLFFFKIRLNNYRSSWKTEAYSEPFQISQMKRFAKVGNCYQKFTIFVKILILYVWQGFQHTCDKENIRASKSYIFSLPLIVQVTLIDS